MAGDIYSYQNVQQENPDWSQGKYFSDRFIEGQSDRYGQKSDAVMNRGGYTYDPTQYNQAMQQAQDARASQQYGLSQLRQLADPTMSSAASTALVQQASQGARLQQGLAGLARGGPAQQMAAQQQAATQGLYAGQQAQQQAATLRAQEAGMAANQYGQAAAAMRSGDMAGQGMAGQYAQSDFANRMRTEEQNAARQRSLEGTRSGYLGLAGQSNAARSQQNIDEWKMSNAIREGNADRTDRLNAAASNAVAAGLGTLGQQAGNWASSGQDQSSNDSGRAERDRDNYYSDERVKEKVQPMASKKRMSDAEAARQMAKTDAMFGSSSTADRIGEDMQRATSQPVAEGVQRALDRQSESPQDAVDATRGDVAEGVQNARSRETTLPQEMMRSLGGGYAYNYTPDSGEDPSKRRYGVMAQDLEKTPMGASVVHDTPGGKMVDTRMATGVQFAALSDLQRQLDELKGGRRGR